MYFLNYCFALIIILIQSLPSYFVLIKLSQNEKIEILNKMLVNVDIWYQFKSIKVKCGNIQNKQIYTVNNIFDNIAYKKYIFQNNMPLVKKPDELRLSQYLHVNSSNYEYKVDLIFKFIRCKCWKQIKFCNRILSYMTNGYKMIYDKDIITQERTMTLKIKDLLLKKIQEYKELVGKLFNYACFFKRLFPEGKDKISDGDLFFSKLLSIINMPLPDGDNIANDLNDKLKKSFKDMHNSSKNLCIYSKKIPHKFSYDKSYKDSKSASLEYKESFAQYMSKYFDLFAKETYELFSQLSLYKN